MPENEQAKTSKILLVIIIILAIVLLSWIGFYFFKNNKTSQITSTPSPKLSTSTITPNSTSSSLLSPSPVLSPSPTAATSSTYQIPAGETYLLSSMADTNGDGKDETLVVTAMSSGKYHVYVLSSTGANLFDDKTFTQKPLRIATQAYDTNEKYPSWMLIFTEQSGNLALIHWNGRAYEIPRNELGI